VLISVEDPSGTGTPERLSPKISYLHYGPELVQYLCLKFPGDPPELSISLGDLQSHRLVHCRSSGPKAHGSAVGIGHRSRITQPSCETALGPQVALARTLQA
jgi:hypothetical protein